MASRFRETIPLISRTARSDSAPSGVFPFRTSFRARTTTFRALP